MEHLLQYINSLAPHEREDFASRCGTTIGYLRKAISAKKPLGESLCINIDRESDGVVRCEHLRQEVDWAYLRNANAAKSARQVAHG